ncbi:hypothetical protein HMPREF1425_01088 [Helicobacter pylori GAM71Ai]|nr:hypothetical protein HMPREF1425_01088 [Helicobacter pylori GAM71Ai]EMH41689.1 hypothetical protein HMPREF1431_01526 [Helicobacter pylori GAMchJs106B]
MGTKPKLLTASFKNRINQSDNHQPKSWLAVHQISHKFNGG